MKIVIDTKEDLHNLRHIIQLLHAISVNAGSKKYDYGSSPDLFSDSSSSSPSPVPETPSGIFNMFDAPSSSSSSTEIPDIFNQKKDDDDSKGLMDSLQTY